MPRILSKPESITAVIEVARNSYIKLRARRHPPLADMLTWLDVQELVDECRKQIAAK